MNELPGTLLKLCPVEKTPLEAGLGLLLSLPLLRRRHFSYRSHPPAPPAKNAELPYQNPNPPLTAREISRNENVMRSD